MQRGARADCKRAVARSAFEGGSRQKRKFNGCPIADIQLWRDGQHDPVVVPESNEVATVQHVAGAIGCGSECRSTAHSKKARVITAAALAATQMMAITL